jgi:cyclopropane fatty-acyl-phospholipid synthase-like methyltransferase
MNRENPKKYWDKNINKWGKFYLETSHSEEEFNAPAWLSTIYRILIVPIEAHLMGKRYKLTLDFINHHVRPGMIIADIGCGTGVFTIEMLKRGANVIAIDISKTSLEATRRNVKKVLPKYANKVTYLQLDVSKKKIPPVDLSLAMGVTPYIKNIDNFYANILSRSKIFYCLILDPQHIFNKIRLALPILNVRNAHCFERNHIDRIIKFNQSTLIKRYNFASGYLDLVCSDTR